jgi:hypothetical protein
VTWTIKRFIVTVPFHGATGVRADGGCGTYRPTLVKATDIFAVHMQDGAFARF